MRFRNRASGRGQRSADLGRQYLALLGEVAELYGRGQQAEPEAAAEDVAGVLDNPGQVVPLAAALDRLPGLHFDGGQDRRDGGPQLLIELLAAAVLGQHPPGVDRFVDEAGEGLVCGGLVRRLGHVDALFVGCPWDAAPRPGGACLNLQASPTCIALSRYASMRIAPDPEMPQRRALPSVEIMAVDPSAEIDHEGPVTPYRQLAEILKARIARGDWAEGRPIASETRLVQEYGLARSTVRRAIAVLVEDGAVWTVQGRGTYVGQPPAEG